MFVEKLREPEGSAARTGDPSSLEEVFASAFHAARVVDNSNASQVALERAYDQRIDAITKAGVTHDLSNPQRLQRGLSVPNEMGFYDEPEVADPHAEFDRKLHELAAKHPEHLPVFKLDRSVREEAKEIARQAEARSQAAWERAPNLYGAAGATRLAGGFVGAGTDPINVAALAAGPWGRVGVGAKQLLWMGVKQGAVNAGAETAIQPFVQAWRKEAGLDYGLGPAVGNIGMAAAFGAIDPAVRTISRGVQRLRGREPILDASGKVTGWREPMPASEALEQAARNAAPDSVLRKAYEGDVEAMHQLAKEAGIADDPAIVGARQAAEIEHELAGGKPVFVDDSEGFFKLGQAFRSSVDDAEPPPRGADPVLPQRKGFERLADDGPAPPASFKLDGRPVAFREMPSAEVGFDAGTFQFKGNGNAQGVSQRLAGVEQWDPIAAGRAIVFERADGSKVIADGHQRVALAQRLEQTGHEPIAMPATIFREADGWTAADVRAIAARKNLQEGSGDVLDAARAIRDRPDIIDSSVPLSSHAMRQARNLARLSDEAFAAVMSGQVAPNHAAVVGDLVEARSQHAPIIRALAEAEPNNEREARHIIADLVHGPRHEVQETLLGGHANSSLLAERAQVLDRALKLLKEDAQIFAILSKEADRIARVGNKLAEDANAARVLQSETVSALIETLATKPGPVREWLDDAARAVDGGGTKPKDAATAFAEQVRRRLLAKGLEGLKPDMPTLRGERGIDDPGGVEAREQIAALEAALDASVKKALHKVAERNLARWFDNHRANGRTPSPIDPVVKAEVVRLIAQGESVLDAIRQARQTVEKQRAAEAEARARAAKDEEPRVAEAGEGGDDDAALLRALTSVPRWQLQAADFADMTARRVINDLVDQGRPYVVRPHTVATGLDAVRPLQELLPEGWEVGLVSRVEPVGNGRVRLILSTLGGSVVEIVRPWREIRGNRAITFPSDRFIALFRPELVGNFRHSVRGEVWHELVHAVFVSDASDRLDDVARALLVRHAESLRVLDMSANDFFAKIGRRDLVRQGRPITLRQLYERNYSTRWDPAVLIAEEAVAHMVELIHHGALKTADVSPVLPILERAFGEQLTRRLKANDAAAKFVFAGPRAMSADLLKLDAAQSMENAGLTDIEIFQHTGWFRDSFGEWTFQIPKTDVGLAMRPEKIAKGQFKTKAIAGEAGNLIKAPQLFEAYPELADIILNLQHRKTVAAGAADFETGIIDVVAGSEKQMHARLVEQLQRFVNEIEKRPAGGEPRAMTAIRKAAEDLDREASAVLEKLAALDDAVAKVQGSAADRKALLEQFDELRRARAELDNTDWTVAWTIAERRRGAVIAGAEKPLRERLLEGLQRLEQRRGDKDPRGAVADEGEDWEASLFEELSRRSAVAETARERAAQGRAKPGTIVKEGEHPLVKEIATFERAQWKAGKTAEEIAAAIAEKFGFPVDPATVARREVWWHVGELLKVAAGSGHWPGEARAEFARLWSLGTLVTTIQKALGDMLGRPVSAGAVSQQRLRQGLPPRGPGGEPALSDAARSYAMKRLAERADGRRVTSSMIAKEIADRYREKVSPEYLRVLAQRGGLAGDPNAVWTPEALALLTREDIAGLSIKQKAAVLRAQGVQVSYDTVWRKVRELGQAPDQEPRFAAANDEGPPLLRGRNLTDAMEDATRTADLSELVRACRA